MNLKQLFGYGVVLYVIYALFGNPIQLNIDWGRSPIDLPTDRPPEIERVGDGEVLICRSKGAEVFHDHRCWGLSHCSHAVIKVEVAEAGEMGYRACKICFKRY